MKGLGFMVSRRAFPILKIIPLALLRLLKMGGGEERRKAPNLVFPRTGVPISAVNTSVLIRERFFQSSRGIEKTSALVSRAVHKGADRVLSFLKKTRVSRHSLKESLRHGGKEALHPGESFGSKYVSRWTSFRERSTLGSQPDKERIKYAASFMKESNLRSKASENLLREALFDKKESRAHVNASFLKESMRESFTHPKGREENTSPAFGTRTVNIGTVYIEGAQIRDFESFKRELSSAVEDL